MISIRRGGAARLREQRRHAVEHRQGETHARPAQERTARHRTSGNMGRFHHFSFSQENPAADQRVDEIARAIAIGGARVEHLLDLRAIREARRGSGGVDRELLQEIARQLAGIRGEDRLQIADVAKTPPVRQRAARIHGAGDRVCKVVAGVVDAGDALAFGGAPVMRPPPPQRRRSSREPVRPDRTWRDTKRTCSTWCASPVDRESSWRREYRAPPRGRPAAEASAVRPGCGP